MQITNCTMYYIYRFVEAAICWRDCTPIPYEGGERGRIGKDLAELTGVDASLISLFEKGKRRPGLSTLEKITKTLDVPQHLFTLLAAEPDDLKGTKAEDVQRASESLARILLINGQKPRKSRTPRRSRKKAA